MSTGAGPLFGSNAFALPTTGGSNQWMDYPSLPNMGMQSFNSSQNGFGGSSNPFAGATSYGTGTSLPGGPTLTGPPSQGNQPTAYPVGSETSLGGGMFTGPTMDPSFTGNFYAMLQQLLGVGGGGSGLQNQLLSFLQGGPTSMPGANQLEQLATTGDPINVLPEWQQMVAAQQQNIQQNQANLKEQFAFTGDLASSPFGTSMSNYEQGVTAQQNALLGQLSTQAMQQAVQNQLTASQGLTSMEGNESQFLEQLMASMATSSPGIFGKQQSSMLGGIGSLIGGAGAGMAGLAKLLPLLGL